ncbi:MAG: alpha/beta hydrolase [Alphaproteobacteria bacterium]
MNENSYVHFKHPNPHAPAVIFLAGFVNGADFWDFALPIFQPHCNVVLFNNPGINKAPTSGVYNLGGFAIQAADVMERLGYGRYAAIGISMGSWVAQELMRHAPERLTCAVLMSTNTGRGHMRAHDLPYFATMVGQDWESYNRLLKQDPLRWMAALFGRRFVLGQPEAYAAYAQKRSAVMNNVGMPTYVLHSVHAGAFDSASWAHKLTTPTLIYNGTEDPLTTCVGAEKLAKAMPNATYHALLGVGHYPPLEDPTVLPQSLAFVQRHAEAAPMPQPVPEVVA